jgi:D-alanine-D-alanine ligase-like ATP-grasp enzyme
MKNSAKVIFDAAKKMGLEPKLIVDYGLILFKYKGRDVYFFNSVSDLNSSIGSYISKNKHTTRVILERNKLPNIPFILPKSMDEALAFLKKYKKIMIKPTHGRKSIGIKVTSGEEELKKLDLSHSILEEFIDGVEYKVLVLNKKIIAIHLCIFNPKTKEMKRISLDAKDWDNEMIEVALKAAKFVDLEFASVDFLKDENGKLFILEINSAPGIAIYYSPDEGPAVDVSTLLIKATLEKFDKER